ncbi:MAG: DUF2779 domain-containing protein [Acholeplasmataceae bacterium]|nr:DUF2779 domain-containing protein [Acholeplasmataceae bacterium]MDD4193753.1 DUF2779 domain-containing protein [Acholeplasmataceae bacterium]
MKISKTRFINYARCPRFCALDEIYHEKDKAVVAFSDDPELDELMSLENLSKISAIQESMRDEEDEDVIETEDPQMEIMLPYYNQIEILAGDAIKKRYQGDVIYNLDTYKQKKFSFEEDGFQFYCFLDGYQEDKDKIRIFEVKATTSKKFVELAFTEDKVKTPIFDYSPEGILMLQEDLGNHFGAKYQDKIEKLKDKLSNVGRYVYDLSYQRYVIEKSLKINKPIEYFLVVLNTNYIHEGNVDKEGKPIYTDDIVQFINLTSLTKEMMPILDSDMAKVLKDIDHMNASPCELGKHCQRKDTRECKFFPVCYHHIPAKNSIYSYLGYSHGFKDLNGQKHELYDLINEGYVKATDIPYDWLNRENNKIQRKVMDSKIPYLHENKIKKGIESLQYPIYHLDFESFPCPLPRFRGETPYSQSLFQYSIHIEKEPGVCDKNLDNYSFISYVHEDQRELLIQNMLDVVKDDGGSILVYNQSFEKTRLKELAEIFPKYQKRLLEMNDRVFDLMHLLRGNKKLYEAFGFDKEEASIFNYYHEDLNGSFSIKKVLPIFSELTYKDMEIGNGTDALVAYAKFPDMDKEIFEITYKNLLEYCKQDTWAMVKILDELRKLV